VSIKMSAFYKFFKFLTFCVIDKEDENVYSIHEMYQLLIIPSKKVADSTSLFVVDISQKLR